jgi:transcriptional regulator with XRE-family HTH domain
MDRTSTRQKDLQTALGNTGIKISQSSLSGYLTGNVEIPIDTLSAIANYLNVPISDLISNNTDHTAAKHAVNDTVLDYKALDSELLMFLNNNHIFTKMDLFLYLQSRISIALKEFLNG